MTAYIPFKVIHWDYNPPAKTDVFKEKFDLLPIQQGFTKDVGKRAIMFRMTYKIGSNNNTILSYISECGYMVDKQDNITHADIIKMVSNAFAKCIIEFDLRKENTPLQSNTLRLDETKIDPEPILRLLLA